MKQQLNILFLILFLVFDVFSTVYAASDLFCNNYAKSSQRQYQEGRRLGCGFPVNKSGWYSGFDYPFRWCLKNSKSSAIKERNRRNNALTTCKMRKSGSGYNW